MAIFRRPHPSGQQPVNRRNGVPVKGMSDAVD
jgi:hypothetical protein